MRRSRSVCLRLNQQKSSHFAGARTQKSASVSNSSTSFKPEYVFLASSRVHAKAA